MGRIILPDENRLVKQLREWDNDAIKDILQNIFVKILKNLNHFVFLGAGSLQAWIGRIATNESIEYLRQKNRERWVALDWDVPDEPEQEDPLIDDIADILGIKADSSASNLHYERFMEK